MISLSMIISVLVCFNGTAQGTTGDAVQVLVGDDPAACLSLESIFFDGTGYMAVDGRNNRGRIKYFTADGAISGTGISTIPLPDAASLPGDILPSPWGLDRVVPLGESLYCVPAPWSGSIVEVFDKTTGTLIERRIDRGISTAGVVNGPDGSVWAVGRRGFVDVNPDSERALNLGSTIQHIDTACGHPLGFVVFEQPQMFLVESTGIIRWRMSLDGIIDGFLSPTDISAGPDGTIAVCAVITDLSNPEYHTEYFAVRDECLSNDDEEGLFGVEDTLRRELATGFVLLMITSEGTVTDAIEMNAAPLSCAVDASGRAHVLVERPDGWAVSILDPRMDEGFEVFSIPVGKPSLISPHCMSSDTDGNLYWDDVATIEGTDYWTIGKLPTSSRGGMFTLGQQPGETGEIVRLNVERLGNFVRQTTALGVGQDGNIYVGYQDFSFELIDDQTIDEESDKGPYESMVMVLDGNGNVLRDVTTFDITQQHCFVSGFTRTEDKTLAVMAGSDTGPAIGYIDGMSTWNPVNGLSVPLPVANGRIGDFGNGYIGWFLYPDVDTLGTSWLEFPAELSGTDEIRKLTETGCRLLATDRGSGTIYATIDDGDIFRIEGANRTVTGVWNNRLPSGAPSHPLNDAAKVTDGLAILDLEHRAILLVPDGAFVEPAVASEFEISEALTLIRTALYEWEENYGFYPPPSPGLLENLMMAGDRDKVQRAFLGGRIYNYRPTEIGYTFVAWSAVGGQPVLLCGLSGEEEIY